MKEKEWRKLIQIPLALSETSDPGALSAVTPGEKRQLCYFFLLLLSYQG